ncbi:ABC transporter permease [Deinococcus metallilatus]|uniref:ABC transporter permease n=1 Tax=Deinococcus metallilatus TaxID=1211322 RepID=A0AAJ5JYY1_9DEIO|nr:ABC transporter permease [Deinococcus metallilatus]MBB5294947.1 NitT/TauT family transport system permease protein [Deinococcus metallilatus]QBY09354.1 ABC transporter permease [Deinococcus metallilatus]RXJ09359.1 ABC transporter permease [Deinococcus metallilatus]TLK28881.1 ABC transporter permease [Deinococcus metallilatus]GMA16878.1 ABC transporter permease [Deinococcus metallilatus]
MASGAVTWRGAVRRPGLGAALPLALSTLGLLGLAVALSRQGAAPGRPLPWLLGVLALLLLGVLGIHSAARGEGRAARVLPAAFTLLLTVLGVEVLLRAYGVPAGLIPTPSRVLTALWEARTVLLLDTFYTFVLEALLGFLAGTVLGLALALLVVRFRFLERGALPYAALFSSVPIVALAPVVVKALGLEWPSKAVVVAITVLFPVVVNAVRGLQAAQPLHLDLLHTYAASPAQTFRNVRVPTALPFVFNALKVGSTLALISAIVAEFFGTNGHGLGFRIQIEVGRFNLAVVWAAIVLASVVGLAFFGLISVLERRFAPVSQNS